jgi:hypothetical protein
MGWLRKKGKQIASGFRKVGRKLKKGLGKIAKAFGKLGPLGSIALSMILPGLGDIAGWLGKTISSMGPAGKFLVDISTSIYNAASGVVGGIKNKIGQVFNTVTGAIETGMNTLSSSVGGKGQIGSSFRNFVSDVTGGFIEKSETGLALEQQQFESTLQDAIAKNTKDFDGSSYIEKEGTFTFYDKKGNVVETLTSPDAKRYMELTDNDTLFDDDYGTKPVVDPKTKVKGKPSILETVKDKDLGVKDTITTSREYGAYKRIQPIATAGQQMIAGEEAYEAEVNAIKARKSDYFKGQADYQLAAVEQQNYSHVVDLPMFVDYSNFNPDQDPSQQYLAYRGITDNVNPMDIGGYGFDYEQFLRAQLS